MVGGKQQARVEHGRQGVVRLEGLRVTRDRLLRQQFGTVEHGWPLRLILPKLYAYANPMPYEAARDMEVELAIGLREEGYAVWQG